MVYGKLHFYVSYSFEHLFAGSRIVHERLLLYGIFVLTFRATQLVVNQQVR
jgi:hypothetical protein